MMDRCNFFFYGTRCPFRKSKKSKHFCQGHSELPVKKAAPLECCICQETKNKKDVKIFKCTHIVCKNCFTRLRDTTCPMCRADIEGELSARMRREVLERKEDDQDERDENLLREFLERDQEAGMSRNFGGSGGLQILIPVYHDDNTLLGYMCDLAIDILQRGGSSF